MNGLCQFGLLLFEDKLCSSEVCSCLTISERIFEQESRCPIIELNIAQYIEGTDAFGLESDRARLIRLFFQPVLIAWALWSTGAGGELARWVRERR